MQGQVQILWDEAVQGDIVDNFPEPILIFPLSEGSFQLSAEVDSEYLGPHAWITDADYFYIQVPDGLYLESVILNSDKPISIGLGDPVATDLDIEWTYMISPPQNGNILSQIGLSSLPAGSYGIYILSWNLTQDPVTAHYSLKMSVVPEATSLILSGIGMIALLVLRSRVRPSR